MKLTNEDMLARATVFDAGPPECINGVILMPEVLNLIKIQKYEHVTIEQRGEKAWAICRQRLCLAKDGEWEYESMPSNREQDYIERTRFPSAKKALQFWLDWRREKIQTLLKDTKYVEITNDKIASLVRQHAV